MSIHISVKSIQGKQRKEIIEEIQQNAKEAALQASKSAIEAGLEAEVENQLGREKGEIHRASCQLRQSEWKCGYCGCQDANQFTRDGHYQRNLETCWEHIQGLRIPMLECQQCGHDVVCHFTIAPPPHAMDQRLLVGGLPRSPFSSARTPPLGLIRR